jgi:hypothetical protein
MSAKKKFSAHLYQVNAGKVTAMAQMTALWGNRSITVTTGTTLPSSWKHPAVLQVSIKTGCCMALTIPTTLYQTTWQYSSPSVNSTDPSLHPLTTQDILYLRI